MSTSSPSIQLTGDLSGQHFIFLTKAERALFLGATEGNRGIFLWCYKDTRLIKFAPTLNLTWRWRALTFKRLLYNSQHNWWPSLIFTFQMQINLFYFFSPLILGPKCSPSTHICAVISSWQDLSTEWVTQSIQMFLRIKWDGKIQLFKPKSPAFSEWDDLLGWCTNNCGPILLFDIGIHS